MVFADFVRAPGYGEPIKAKVAINPECVEFVEECRNTKEGQKVTCVHFLCGYRREVLGTVEEVIEKLQGWE